MVAYNFESPRPLPAKAGFPTSEKTIGQTERNSCLTSRFFSCTFYFLRLLYYACAAAFSLVLSSVVDYW